LSDALVNILGVGNTLMGDDGVGPLAAQALLRGPLPEGAAVYDAGLAVSDVLGALDPSAALIVIDALRAAGPPGTVYQAQLEDMTLMEGTLAGLLSLHEISVLPALRIEAMTGREFRDVTVFGVEPASARWGEGLSAPVARAMRKLTGAVLEHAARKLESLLAAAGDTTR